MKLPLLGGSTDGSVMTSYRKHNIDARVPKGGKLVRLHSSHKPRPSKVNKRQGELFAGKFWGDRDSLGRPAKVMTFKGKGPVAAPVRFVGGYPKRKHRV